MDKLVLIDGNSLLNRAYYAMKVFATKEGLPTNGIYGFVRLLFKIMEDVEPAYLIVTFDLHAPTFRHKLYKAYKATRKPMPDELAVQVPVLKDLLKSMRICIVEKEGFEADDLIGTLSRRFPDVETYIYTGDRDAYQLVKENVNVCFTKRGVSDIELLTAENFFEKVGFEPRQIVDEKALMGDPSDNIPGVKGIGPKNAAGLLKRYGSLEEIYNRIGEVSVSLRDKLVENEDTAKLSKLLATIVTDVPLSLALEDCRLRLPFPEEARAFFSGLEFRSLLDSSFFPSTRIGELETVEVSDISDFLKLLPNVKEFSVSADELQCHISFADKEYVFCFRDNLFAPGIFPQELTPVLRELFSGDKTALVSDIKQLSHRFEGIDFNLSSAEDVSLLRYLADSNFRPEGTAREFTKDYMLPESNRAYSIRLAYADAKKQADGTAAETLYRELERPLINVLLDMERTGVRVDMQKFSEFSERFNEELSALSERIFALAGVERFNLNSPFQLSEVLFDKLGYDTRNTKRNAREGYSTSAEVLERLAEEHEIARLILRYRELQKLLSTYVDGIRPLVKGDVVHTTYNQTATTTGRLSSTNPNLQNIPVRTEAGRELRKLFIAREGNILVDADYSQIELRLLAHLSSCKALLEAYRNGEDIHAATAARVFGVPLSQVTDRQRRRAKTINFGIIYGMSAFGLAKDLGCSSSEAQEYIEKYFAAHPEVKAYMDENVRLAKENGYVTTILGRKRFIKEIRAQSHSLRAFGERAAMNMPLQGSAADIIKIAMLRVYGRLQKDGFRSKLVLQVHDELVLDTPIEERERAEAMLKEEMEQAVSLSVPLTVQVSAGRSWYDAK